MYIIINKTNNSVDRMEGDYPFHYINDRLNRGEDIIIISLYSNTIKIPYFRVENGLKYWENKEYFLPYDIIKDEYLINNGK